MKMAAALALAVACAGPALANPFDDCVLENMRGVTSDLAAKSVKVSCLRRASVDVPADALAKVRATANYGEFNGPGNTGFLMEIDNQTDYVLTEITLSIRPDKMPERVVRTDDFWPLVPKGIIYTGPPPDPTRSMQIKPFATSSYWIPMKTNIVIDPKKVAGPGYAWNMLSARGVPPK